MSDAKPRIYLASRSPRRAELLQQIGVQFVQFVQIDVDVDETPAPDESATAYVERIAIAKANAGRAALPTDAPGLVLAADTAVISADSILGKPCDQADFLRMMGQLSGRTHEVLTGVALAAADGLEYRASRSRVTFRDIALPEQLAYWASGEPHDKAGGYAIQGLGALFVSALQGSYSGVMGLPLYETAQLLHRAGLRLLTA